jgi:hypothetical protein
MARNERGQLPHPLQVPMAKRRQESPLQHSLNNGLNPPVTLTQPRANQLRVKKPRVKKLRAKKPRAKKLRLTKTNVR